MSIHAGRSRRQANRLDAFVLEKCVNRFAEFAVTDHNRKLSTVSEAVFTVGQIAGHVFSTLGVDERYSQQDVLAEFSVPSRTAGNRNEPT